MDRYGSEVDSNPERRDSSSVMLQFIVDRNDPKPLELLQIIEDLYSRVESLEEPKRDQTHSDHASSVLRFLRFGRSASQASGPSARQARQPGSPASESPTRERLPGYDGDRNGHSSRSLGSATSLQSFISQKVVGPDCRSFRAVVLAVLWTSALIMSIVALHTSQQHSRSDSGRAICPCQAEIDFLKSTIKYENASARKELLDMIDPIERKVAALNNTLMTIRGVISEMQSNTTAVDINAQKKSEKLFAEVQRNVTEVQSALSAIQAEVQRNVTVVQSALSAVQAEVKVNNESTTASYGKLSNNVASLETQSAIFKTPGYTIWTSAPMKPNPTWVLLDGSCYSYKHPLFEVYKQVYTPAEKRGDGTEFCVPDAQSRVISPLGSGGSTKPAYEGSDTVIIQLNQTPAHDHFIATKKGSCSYPFDVVSYGEFVRSNWESRSYELQLSRCTPDFGRTSMSGGTPVGGNAYVTQPLSVKQSTLNFGYIYVYTGLAPDA